ncbi:purine permease [Sporomusaceae bacterium FL31]|nr:purine permease [Sporomusaceae bacterium FL31]GCE34770.1 purine permease [Sporomusaceae bacterium]
MNQKQFKYQVDDVLPAKETFLYGLQWLLVLVPLVLILGQVGAGLHYPLHPQLQLLYLQKMFFSTGLVLILQLLWGHKLPVIVGPASILLLGIIVNAGATDAVYSSIALCGVLLACLAAGGILKWLTDFFTMRIIGIVLLLISFTLLPTVLHFITAAPDFSFGQGIFAVGLVLVMLAGQRFLPELLRSTIIVWALLAGSGAYYLFFEHPIPVQIEPVSIAAAWQSVGLVFAMDWSVFISFLFCFMALTANDLGSVQTTAVLLGRSDAAQRTKWGLVFTGLGNGLAGILGVLGPVNYSLSTGVILASGCASRYPLMAAAVAMMSLACIPAVLYAFSYIPSVVVGSLLFYMLCAQISGGLGVLSNTLVPYRFEFGIVVGVPVLLGTCIAFLPAPIGAAIPSLWRPLVTNGFVVGVTVAIILEKLLLPETRKLT